MPEVGLAEGYFTVILDWGGDKFQGEARWLDVSVRCPAGGGPYEPLTPRQPLTATPYALYTMGAPWPGIVDMPPDFADGVDNDTTYSAGTGLTLAGTTFAVDPTSVQSRVTGVCGTGYAIREVNQDGSVTCEPVGGCGATPGCFGGARLQRRDAPQLLPGGAAHSLGKGPAGFHGAVEPSFE